MNILSEKKPRRLKGVVTSTKMQNTIVVRVGRLVKHSKYLKYQKSHNKFLVHDAKGEARVGDLVMIHETRPLSRRKRWILGEILGRGQSETIAEEE